MRTFLDHIELWLSAAGVVVVITVPALLLGTEMIHWRASAVTAVAVGVLHGIIFWLVRRRQRQVRRQAIDDIRAMLADIVNNQLTVIITNIKDRDDADEERERIAAVTRSVRTVSTLVGSLSEEALGGWRARYEAARAG
jgi:hypothetical protein